MKSLALSRSDLSEVQPASDGSGPPKREMRGPGYGHVVPDVFHHMAFKRSVAMLGELLRAEAPFFYGLGISGTHTPLVPPLSFVRAYEPSAVALPPRPWTHGPPLARKDGFQSAALSPRLQFS